MERLVEAFSHKTIGTYKARLMEKLSFRTTSELVLHARELLGTDQRTD